MKVALASILLAWFVVKAYAASTPLTPIDSNKPGDLSQVAEIVEELDNYEEVFPEELNPFKVARNYGVTNYLPYHFQDDIQFDFRHKNKDKNVILVPCSSHQTSPMILIPVSQQQPVQNLAFLPPQGHQPIPNNYPQYQSQNNNQFQYPYQVSTLTANPNTVNKVVVVNEHKNTESQQFQYPMQPQPQYIVNQSPPPPPPPPPQPSSPYPRVSVVQRYKTDREASVKGNKNFNTICHIKSEANKHEIQCNKPRNNFPLVACRTIEGQEAFCTSEGPNNQENQEYVCGKIEENHYFCILK